MYRFHHHHNEAVSSVAILPEDILNNFMDILFDSEEK